MSSGTPTRFRGIRWIHCFDWMGPTWPGTWMSLSRWVRSPHWMPYFCVAGVLEARTIVPNINRLAHTTRAAGDGLIWILTEAFSARVSYAPCSRVDCHVAGIALAL